MTKTRIFAPVLMAALLALPALAQETATGDAGGGATGDLSLGTPVEDGIGSTYVADTHGDWEIRCIRAEEGQFEPCQLYQLLLDENENPVAEFNVFDIPDEDPVVAGATIVTPLDTLLTPQLRLSVDGGQARQYPFAFCQQIGCFVRLGLTEADLGAFRAGAAAQVTIVPLPAPDQTVNLRVSLTGFTDGYAALVERMSEMNAVIEQQREASE